jgi:hypothetical protein
MQIAILINLISHPEIRPLELIQIDHSVGKHRLCPSVLSSEVGRLKTAGCTIQFISDSIFSIPRSEMRDTDTVMRRFASSLCRKIS